MKPIPEFDGYLAKEDGTIWSMKYGYLKQVKDHPKGLYGNRQVVLRKQGKYVGMYVSRLILLTFVGAPPTSEYEACHKNDVKEDNRLENLYWGTRYENAVDRIRNGKQSCKLSEELVSKIRHEVEYKTVKQLCKEYGVNRGTIHKVRTKRTWSHVE